MKLYDILLINKDASLEEIKKAYKKSVLKYHPDKNQNQEDEEMIKKINFAYSVLSNQERREVYDSVGDDDVFEQNNYDLPTDVIDETQSDVPNITEVIDVSIDKIFFGCTISKVIKRFNVCQSCNNSSKNTDLCEECKGMSYVTTKKIIHINIPPGGIKDNIFVLTGEGHQIPTFDNSIKRSDVLIGINITNLGGFKKYNGVNLLYNLDISLLESLVGFKKIIKHLDGSDIELIRDNITLHGDEECIKGKGLTTQGDLFVKINIIRQKLNKSQINSIMDIFH